MYIYSKQPLDVKFRDGSYESDRVIVNYKLPLWKGFRLKI